MNARKVLKRLKENAEILMNVKLVLVNVPLVLNVLMRR